MTLKNLTALLMLALTTTVCAFADMSEQSEAPCSDLCTEIETPKVEAAASGETSAVNVEAKTVEEDRGNEI